MLVGAPTPAKERTRATRLRPKATTIKKSTEKRIVSFYCAGRHQKKGMGKTVSLQDVTLTTTMNSIAIQIRR